MTTFHSKYCSKVVIKNTPLIVPIIIITSVIGTRIDLYCGGNLLRIILSTPTKDVLAAVPIASRANMATLYVLVKEKTKHPNEQINAQIDKIFRGPILSIRSPAGT